MANKLQCKTNFNGISSTPLDNFDLREAILANTPLVLLESNVVAEYYVAGGIFVGYSSCVFSCSWFFSNVDSAIFLNQLRSLDITAGVVFYIL